MPCFLGEDPFSAVPAPSLPAPASGALTLVVVCAWCGRAIGRGAVSNQRIVSHGICRLCSDDVLFSDAPELLHRR